MAELRLAGNLIENLAILGFNYGHLQVVLAKDDATQLENEVQAPFFATIPFGGKWQYPDIRDHTATDNTSNYGVNGEYAYTTLNLGDRSAESVWDILTQVRNNFDAKGSNIDYDIDKNSNSYATSLLSVIGINVNDVIAGATPSQVSEFPGVGVNVLNSEIDAFSLNLDGGTENDIFHTGIRDDIIAGMAGNDTLTTESGNDTLNGGTGNDTLNGGIGGDVYHIARSGDGIDTIIDEDGQGTVFLYENNTFTGINGSATRVTGGTGNKQLYEIENVKFEYDPSTKILNINDWSGKSTDDKIIIKDFDNGELGINLEQGTQDLIFAIDLSGSMGDDIAAVKASVNEILNTIFAGTQNSRIGIITFNDVGSIHTVLNFTNDPEAARSAINSLSILGGGAEPLNGALLHALNGGAGLWRADTAVDRRIVVFSDEPPADPEKAAEVTSTSANVGAVIEEGSAPIPLRLQSEAINLALASTTPVDIFTVAIGSDPNAISALAEIATNNRGQSFTAATADDLVAALISAITVSNNNELPIPQDDSVTTRQETAVNISVLNNDSDPDGNVLAIDSFTQGANGLVTLSDNGTLDDTSDDFLIYTPIKQLNPKIGFNDSFEYTISDGNGGIVTATVNVAVGKIEKGGNGKDSIFGTSGDDVLSGGNSKDKLYGAAGNDLLQGDKGSDLLFGDSGNDTLRGGLSKDTLNGGLGNDTLYSDRNDEDILTGGDDLDVFVFTKGSKAVITDFELGIDKIDLVALNLTSVNSILNNAEYDAEDNTLELEIGNKGAKVEIELIGLNLGQLVTGDFLI